MKTLLRRLLRGLVGLLLALTLWRLGSALALLWTGGPALVGSQLIAALLLQLGLGLLLLLAWRALGRRRPA